MAVTSTQCACRAGAESEREEPREGFCPFCACRLNPGERVCLDCLLDLSIEGN